MRTALQKFFRDLQTGGRLFWVKQQALSHGSPPLARFRSGYFSIDMLTGFSLLFAGMPKWTWIFLLLFVAALGGFLIDLPGRILTHYHDLEKIQPVLAKVYLYGAFALLAALVGLAIYIVGKLYYSSKQRSKRDNPTSQPKTPQEQKDAIAKNAQEALKVAEKGDAADREAIVKQLKTLENKQDTGTLEIVAFGTVSSGKSALLNALAGQDLFHSDVKAGSTTEVREVAWPSGEKIVLKDTPGIAEVSGASRDALARNEALSADVVLVVIDGTLKSFEHAAIQALAGVNKRVFVCLNKADWISARDREVLLDQLRGQVKGMIAPDDIMVVQAKASERLRTRVLPDGTEQEEVVLVPPDISPLTDRILEVTQRDGKDLLLANVLLRSNKLVAEARDRVRAYMDKRAAAVVESHMWQAGAVAALPLPTLDLIGTSAVIVKMAAELSSVYGQSMNLDDAGKLLRELGKNMVGLLGMHALAPTVASLSASFIKSVPGVGTLIGGAVQGFTQALVTRWIGLVLIEHFRSSTREDAGSFKELARKKWEELTTPDALARFLKTWQSHSQKD
jgi:GTP-binding protein EngB required for normal cell division/uncharacterized protein (DUF697 family)